MRPVRPGIRIVGKSNLRYSSPQQSQLAIGRVYALMKVYLRLVGTTLAFKTTLEDRRQLSRQGP